MEKHNHTWILDGISTLLNRETLDRIRCTPVSLTNLADKLVWPWNAVGTYTVKSGYHRFHARLHTIIPTHSLSSHSIPEFVWKFVWKIKTLPKIKHFLWRALSCSLSTRLSLFRRKIVSNPICPICECYEESIEHILFLYPWTQLVWFGSELSYRIDHQGITCLHRWLEGILLIPGITKADHNHCLSLISFICWEIWKTRCHFVFEGTTLDPSRVIVSAREACTEFVGAIAFDGELMATQALPTNSISRRTRWSPPTGNILKVNFDGAWIPGSCTGGIGVVIRDFNGVWCGGLSSPPLSSAIQPLLLKLLQAFVKLPLQRKGEWGRLF
ncbi:unnamed protein product [Prunus brigantina]